MLPVLFTRNSGTAGWPVGFDRLAGWSRDLDRWLEDVLPGTMPAFPVDVRQEGENLVMEAELPGLSQNDIDITVENGILTISGEVKEVTEEKKTNYHLKERRWGRFSRSFRLPETADGEKVSAELKDGVLTLRVPTREEAKPRRIPVK
jgi:HSP20 family protein